MSVASARRFRTWMVVAAVSTLLAACGDESTPNSPSPNPNPSITLTAPSAVAPADDIEFAAGQPELVVSNSTSNRTGQRRYEFQVSETASFAPEGGLAGVVATKTVDEGSGGQTKTVIDQTLRPGTRYYWRARALQESTTGPWSPSSRFRIAQQQFPLFPPNGIEPTDNAQLDTLRPRLVVANSTTAAPGPRSYEFQLADNSGFGVAGGGSALRSGIVLPEGANGTTVWQVDQDLKAGTRFYWRVRVLATAGVGEWSTSRRFVTKAPPPNTPPVIRSLTGSSGRAEVTDQVSLSAIVEDAETASAQLTFHWTATGGSFTGTGPSTTWRPPVTPTPMTHVITLTVIERYTVPIPDGGDTPLEHRVSASVAVDVNDSPTELTELSLTFLRDFANSRISPEVCVRNFSDNCRGKQAELRDIINNRNIFEILGATYHVETLTIGALRMNATIILPCEFTSRVKATGKIEIAHGNCRLTGVYENKQWRLCESNFDSTKETTVPFIF